MSKIIYGPSGSGKTTNAKALQEHYGCTSLVDGWDGKENLPGGALALTNVPNRAAVPIAEALAELQRSKNSEPI